MKIKENISLDSLSGSWDNFWVHAAGKTYLLNEKYDEASGSPVFTVRGKYTSKGWKEWAQGFQFGISLLYVESLMRHLYYKLAELSLNFILSLFVLLY